MDIVKNVKEMGSELEQGIQSGLEKSKDALANVASHLPFANLAKRKDNNAFEIEIDLPGVNKEDIELNVDDNKLNVSAVRRMKKEVNEANYYMQESFFGKFERTFVLPDDIDSDDIIAKYEDGRLYISLKKQATAAPKSIQVK